MHEAMKKKVKKSTPEELHDVYLLHDTFDDIELIATDNDLFALIQGFKGLKFRLNSGAHPTYRCQ